MPCRPLAAVSRRMMLAMYWLAHPLGPGVALDIRRDDEHLGALDPMFLHLRSP